MALNLDDVARLAKLARLAPSPEQQATLLTQLNGFFEITSQHCAAAIFKRGCDDLGAAAVFQLFADFDLHFFN